MTASLSGDDARKAFRRAVERGEAPRQQPTAHAPAPTGQEGGGQPPRTPPRTDRSASDEPERRLPEPNPMDDRQRRMQDRRAAPGDLPSNPRRRPPTVEELRADGLVGQGWEHFRARERGMAEQLRARGVEVASVAASRVERRRCPDAVIVDHDVTVELKATQAPTFNAVWQSIRQARGQARRVVIDVRGSGTDMETAYQGLGQALRRGGGDLDEVWIMGNGYTISWPR